MLERIQQHLYLYSLRSVLDTHSFSPEDIARKRETGSTIKFTYPYPEDKAK